MNGEEQVEIKPKGTRRLPCSCYHPWQDKTYGKGVRLHNISGRDTKKSTCTVCGKVNNG